MTAPSCSRALVDAHFRGRISPAEERSLRAHLPGCEGCRMYYDRHLVLAAIDPKARSAEERIGAGLGLAPPRRPALAPLSRLGWAGWAACAMAAVLLFVLPLRRHAEDDTFTPRGATSLAAAEPRLFVYRMHPLERIESPVATIHRTDDLAFAYANPSSFEHLLVFGVDEHRHVYWYYPAWTNPAADPRAIAIGGGADVLELPHAIRHDLDGRQLTIHAIFTHADPSVRAVEALVAANDAVDARVPVPDAYEQRFSFTVEP